MPVLAGLIYSVGFNSSNYTKYMKAYQDFTDDITETDSYLDTNTSLMFLNRLMIRLSILRPLILQQPHIIRMEC